jgi:Ran GTPase-activating protein (RanGAP) involved in mRNA processing and transport
MKQLKAESQYQKNLQIQRGDEDQKFLKVIEELLKKDPTVLDLSVKHMTDRQLALLSELLPSLNVKTLNLSHNPFEYAGMLALADALPKTQITNLNLGSTRGCALEKIIQILPQTKIQTLDLYGLDILERDLESLIWKLPQTQIRDLDLGCNKITDPLFGFLMYCLPETKIMRLNLSNNNIRMKSQETKEHFQCGIAGSELRQLDLSDNSMGNAVAFALAEVLPFSKIQKLDISFCRIEQAGIEQLASALSASQVKELDLRMNQDIR